MILTLLLLMLSSELPALHLSKNLDTLLCGYTQPTVGLARSVLCTNLTPHYVESGVTATHACAPDCSGPEITHLQAKALCYQGSNNNSSKTDSAKKVGLTVKCMPSVLVAED